MNSLQRWILALVVTVIAVVGSYQWLDRAIALFCNFRLQRPETIVRVHDLPDPFVALALTIFISLGLWNLSGRALSRFQTCALLSSLSLLVAQATKAQLKPLFGRTWPSTWVDSNPSFLRDGAYGFNLLHGGAGYASFPSGHMAITCAVISVLWIYYPRGRNFYIVATFAVAILLVGGNYHFLSDIIAGGFIGVSAGWIVASLWKTHEHFDSRK